MNNLKETRKMIMVKAHEMCKEMKAQGFEFNYHVQLGLNMKYLWEVVGETIDALETNDEITEDTNKTTIEPEVEEEEPIVEDTDPVVENTDEHKLGSEFEDKECTKCYCVNCDKVTIQYRDGGEFVCVECNEAWELMENEEYIITGSHVEITEDEKPEDDYELEYVNHISLPNNTGYSFLFKLHIEDTVQEFIAFANKNHRLPVVYDADPNDIDLLERVKEIIDEKTNLYSTLASDYVPEYRYTRGEDYFIYFDEAAEIFKGYYCGNDVYGGRGFVFDINSKEGPCSRAIRQLVKDHKAGAFGKYTTMNGKGTTITKWRDKLLEECRALYKLAKNSTRIEEAKAVLDRPWLCDEKRYNAALRFLAQMNVKYDSKFESYDAAIDAKLRNLAETYNPDNKFNKAADKLIVKYQDRIRALELTNLYRNAAKENKQPVQSKGVVKDEFADVEI